MKCTDLEFQKTVHAKYPAKYTHYCYSNAPFTYGVLHLLALDTIGEMSLDFSQKLKLASHAWIARAVGNVDGEVIKDTNGLFNTNLPTSSGPITLNLPSAPNPGSTFTVRLNNPINYLPVTIQVNSDGNGWEILNDPQKASLKCCCGAHSVGSDRHSSWCDVEKGNGLCGV